MFRIRLVFVFIVFLFSSCDYFNTIFNNNQDRIDFTSVDEYPLFPSCDGIATLEFKEKCFGNTITEYLQKDLNLHEFSSLVEITDAIIIHIKIDINGKASLKNIETSKKIKETLPELERIIDESIDNFPILKPAKKRNLYVSSQYMIPLYIVKKTNNK